MRRLLLPFTLLMLLCAPAGAAFAADRPSDLLIDACRDEKVDGTYSQRTYRRALDQLPADSDQYTGCRDVINRARLAALSARDGGGGGNADGDGSSGSTGTSGSSGTGGGGGSNRDGASSRSAAPAAPTDAEQRAVENATRAGAAPVRVGGELLQPGAVRQVPDDGRDLPTPLILLLAVLAACTLAATGAATWSRVNARRLG